MASRLFCLLFLVLGVFSVEGHAAEDITILGSRHTITFRQERDKFEAQKQKVEIATKYLLWAELFSGLAAYFFSPMDGLKIGVSCLGSLIATEFSSKALIVVLHYRAYSQALVRCRNALKEHLLTLFQPLKGFPVDPEISPGTLKQLGKESLWRIALRWGIVAVTHAPSFVRPYDPLTAAEEIVYSAGSSIKNAFLQHMTSAQGGEWLTRNRALLEEYERTLQNMDLDSVFTDPIRNAFYHHHRNVLDRLQNLQIYWERYLPR